jgi:hypothetical protein
MTFGIITKAIKRMFIRVCFSSCVNIYSPVGMILGISLVGVYPSRYSRTRCISFGRISA